MSKPPGYDLKYLCALLNSKLLYFQFKGISSTLGEKGIRYKKVFVEQLPIYTAIPDEQKPFILKTEEILELNKNLQNELNSFKDWFIHTFEIEKLSQKLEKYYELSFDDFLDEIKKEES